MESKSMTRWQSDSAYCTPLLRVNLKTKGRYNTVKIRKFEAEMLRKNGYGYLVINGHGTYHNLLLTEDKNALKFLDDFRNDIKK
jgi:hypothetical protein